jgi:hypothetical protein
MARKLSSLDPQSQQSLFVRLNIVSDKVWESLMAWATAFILLVRKYPKITLFIACAAGVYLGFTYRTPVRTDDPISWIAPNCLVVNVVLIAYFLGWRLNAEENNLALELAHED